MGSQRRLLDALELIGVAEEDRYPMMRAIEQLQSAGDDLSDALYYWTETANRGKAANAVTEVLLGLIDAAIVLDMWRPDE